MVEIKKEYTTYNHHQNYYTIIPKQLLRREMSSDREEGRRPVTVVLG
jgi:hypothetical protein